MNGIKISYSRASSYLHCPQQHYFSYVEKLRRKGVVRPLTFGGDLHKMLQHKSDSKALSIARKEIGKAYNELQANQQGELGEDYLTALDTIFSDYLDTWSDSEEPVETEHEFLIQIGKINGEPVYFHGKVDEVYDDLSIGEHKTFSTAPNMGILAMNMQVCLYAKAHELERGNKLQRVRWDYIKSKPATYPVWLEKSKRFSEAANSNITHLSWLRACDERGIDDTEIRNKAELYRQNIGNFFFRTGIQIVPEMVDTAWKDFKSVCKDIMLRGEINKVKNITRECSYCDFRPICFAEFTGADPEYVKKTDYTIKEEK